MGDFMDKLEHFILTAGYSFSRPELEDKVFNLIVAEFEQRLVLSKLQRKNYRNPKNKFDQRNFEFLDARVKFLEETIWLLTRSPNSPGVNFSDPNED